MLTEVTRQELWQIYVLMKALEDAKDTQDPSTLRVLIETHRLTWEQCPTWLLKERTVLMSLPKYMPIEAMVRKLGLMTFRQVFEGPDGEETLVSHEDIYKIMVHPFASL
ncbi:hypothetical protein DPMN_100674 [Dreissena polymorpha]|uniref:Uncharacterized protein n=1 Tax=Dreissena polymorpha TaxID=45954 RepID=A0A9D4LHC2_DREPO|nr:hypothetical protein DPMN_100674 [Dreissena polymorpha]